MAALDLLRSFLSFHSFIHQGLSPLSFTLVTKVSPFGHSGFSLKVLPLVTKDEGPRFHSSIYIILKWSVTNERTKNERTKNERTDRTHTRIVSFISTDYDVGICINHISWIVWRVFDFQLRGTNLKILYCLTYTIHFYSTITIFWQGIRKYDVVDIFGIVYEMRKERVWMVQTEQQYICIHQVRCKLKITNKALPTISLWIFLDMASTIHMSVS